jgi:hypothetical protein
MNWRLILLFADAGFLIGALACLGFLRGIEWIVWLLFFVFAGIAFARMVAEQMLQHAFVAGLLASIFAAVIELIFFDMWLQVYPMETATLPMNPRLFLLLTSAMMGIVNGAILAGFALFFRNILQIRPKKP